MMTEDRRQKTEDRREKTEDRGQKTEDRREKGKRSLTQQIDIFHGTVFAKLFG
jgi:hypothetical protein